jgi:hypothetical protein
VAIWSKRDTFADPWNKKKKNNNVGTHDRGTDRRKERAV